MKPQNVQPRFFSGTTYEQPDQQLVEVSRICSSYNAIINGANRPRYNSSHPTDDAPFLCGENENKNVPNRILADIRGHNSGHCIPVKITHRPHQTLTTVPLKCKNLNNLVSIPCYAPKKKITVPSVILSNVCHLINKVDELAGLQLSTIHRWS